MKNAIENKHCGFLTMVFHFKYPKQFMLESNKVFPKETDAGILFSDVLDCVFIALCKLNQ
eukprot:GAHX01005299.1.p1 GENE.GAHX01005299.1~~GAHX01005299.1.p1  ORF type:complete len:60 (+),score=8.53 GAHX01005299.1:3-182(+)